MGGDQLGHLEHADALLAVENGLQALVSIDLGADFLVLQPMLPDIRPKFLGQFRPRERCGTDYLGEFVIRLDRLHERSAGLAFCFCFSCHARLLTVSGRNATKKSRFLHFPAGGFSCRSRGQTPKLGMVGVQTLVGRLEPSLILHTRSSIWDWERDRPGRRGRRPADCIQRGLFSAGGRKRRAGRPRSQGFLTIPVRFVLLGDSFANNHLELIRK